MMNDTISEISIIDGKLHVKPQSKSFEFIYRSATEINWDNKLNTLYSPVPRGEWTYFDWFQHMHAAVLDEYVCFLQISKQVIWNNIPDNLRTEIFVFYNKKSE